MMGFRTFSVALAPTLILVQIVITINARKLPQHLWKKDEFLNWRSNHDLILTLKNPLDPILQQIKRGRFYTRGSKLTAMTKAMKKVTEEWQAPVLEALKPYNVDCECFWISNQILVKNATAAVVEAMEAMGSVESVQSERIIPLLPTMNPMPGAEPTGPEWGVLKIGADQVWKETRGEGVVVAVIDTGVRETHNALRGNYVGAENNGWFDPILGLTTPTDNNGHGTHCAGTICGNNGIGVAPAAKWMACRGCDVNGCSQRALLACGQWILCPTDPQGNNADCSKAPHIVSSSWGGGGGGETWFNHVIDAWNAAGIIGFFAIGNEGPSCGTAESPGDQSGVISVGSTDSNDTISTFSSRGPKRAPDGGVVPQIVAPGEGINSASHTSDNGYQILSGTSMANPHAAGGAALMLSKSQGMTRQQMEQILFSTANKNVGLAGSRKCGNNLNVYPNDVTGYGRIDLRQAIAALRSSG